MDIFRKFSENERLLHIVHRVLPNEDLKVQMIIKKAGWY